MDTSELLSRIREGGSEDAFEVLLRRYSPLVYSVSLRRLRDASMAEECSQEVFIRLARLAPQLRSEGELVGWLHTTAHRTAIDHWRKESRRHHREQKAFLVQESDDPPDRHWQELAPVLDEALSELKPADREAILLRYFQSESLRGVGEALGMSEDAAKMKIRRSLERLHALLARKGITCTLAALGVLLEQHSIEAAIPGSLGAANAGRIFRQSQRGAATHSVVQTSLLLMKTKILVAGLAGLLAVWWWWPRQATSSSTGPGQGVKADASTPTSGTDLASKFRRARTRATTPIDPNELTTRLASLREILSHARRLQTYPPASLAEALWKCADIATEAAGVLAEALASPDYETRHWAASGLQFMLQDPAMKEAHASARLALARWVVQPGLAVELQVPLLYSILSDSIPRMDGKPPAPLPVAPELLSVLTASFERRGLDAVSANMVLANSLNAALLASGQDFSAYRSRLAQLVVTGDFEQRLGAAYALSSLPGDKPREVAETLTRALETDSWRVPKAMAATALGRLGSDAVDSLPSLLRFVETLPKADPGRAGVEEALVAIQPDLGDRFPAAAARHKSAETPEAPRPTGIPLQETLEHGLKIARDPELRAQMQDHFVEGRAFMSVPVYWVESLRAAILEAGAQESDPEAKRFLSEASDRIAPQFWSEKEAPANAFSIDPRELASRAMTISGYPETGASAAVQQRIQQLASSAPDQAASTSSESTEALRRVAAQLKAIDETVYREALRSFLEYHPELDRLFR